MDFGLSEELTMLQGMVRGFAAGKIAPFADEWDKNHYFPYEEVVKPMAELGLFGTVIPEEYGGNNMGWLAAAIITEEIARASSSLRVQINMQEIGCAYTIYRYGTEELKKKYIAKLVSAETLGAFAITEPGAGSDVMAIKSTAEDKGDHWLLNGTKTWISNATVGGINIYYAYTDKSAGGRGLSAFVVELDNFNGIALLADGRDHPGGHAGAQGKHPREAGRRDEDRFRIAVADAAIGGRRWGGVGAGVPRCGDEVCDGAAAVRASDRSFSDESGHDRSDGGRDRCGAADGLQGGLAEGSGESQQQPGGGAGEVPGRRAGL
jgi:alkylation response protein AidB-like acyl-CoA dehydrogenase